LLLTIKSLFTKLKKGGGNPTGKHLVLVGGGHAHLTTLKNLDSFVRLGHRVTVVSPSPYHYYSGMGPGMLSGIYRPQEVRFHIRKMAEDRGAAFIEDKAVKIDPTRRLLFLHSGEEIHYDTVSFNTGSEVPAESLMASPQDNVFTVKPVMNLLKVRSLVLSILESKARNLAVIGGGPAGVEIAGNLCRLVYENGGTAQITLIGGKRVLADLSEKVRGLAVASLNSRGAEVIEGSYVKRIGKDTVILTDGREIPFDVALIAVGIRPSSLFRDSGLATGEDGGLLTNSYLHSVAYPDIFGGGDCISLEGRPLAKVGVYAVRQNPILYHNLMATLQRESMKPFIPQEAYLLIFNMGNGRGIFSKKGWVWQGRLAFFLKDYIDRRFMKRFQVSGELAEKLEGER
jgi:NADH dehydrogenase FAD-containing subunit